MDPEQYRDLERHVPEDTEPDRSGFVIVYIAAALLVLGVGVVYLVVTR